jgi:hypothetical protein
MGLQTLSKTRFKLALECPTKVYYSLEQRYVDQKKDDDFLEALAEGGHQIGALAKLMFLRRDPTAVEITSRDQEEQVRETAALLQRENVTVFEATIRYENLLVRVDVLVKQGGRFDLIEVKAKSWDPAEDSLIGQTPRSNPISPDWEPYVYDVAFQERVLALSYPKFEIHPWLMLVDKSHTNSVAGLPLKFPILGEGRNKSVRISPDFDISQLKESLLIQVDASEAVQRAQKLIRKKKGRPDIEFDSLIATTATAIGRGERLGPYVGSPCKSCEFYCPPVERSENNRSGWAECMETYLEARVEGPREESIFGFYGQADISGPLDARRLWIRDLKESDLKVKPTAEKISRTSRHELQWQELAQQNTEPFLQTEVLRRVMGEWKYPIHFIDFETAQPALPFHAGHRPYQQILFQFSHHIATPDGAVRHAAEFLNSDGVDSPSIEVVRRLRQSLENDDSTVLHWYPHERTVLGKIREEIHAVAPYDAAELLVFLDSLGLERDSMGRLFDLGRLAADHVFLAGTGGSSSMKKFLPAVLQHSKAVRERYTNPIYGTTAMPSHNFREQVWVTQGDGAVLNPYQLLSPLFGEHEIDDALARIEAGQGEVVANGAKALIAYMTLQDPQLPNTERANLRKQLLRYCELDTFAMVMVYQALREWLS